MLTSYIKSLLPSLLCEGGITIFGKEGLRKISKGNFQFSGTLLEITMMNNELTFSSGA
jgi:hypothetical protein